MTLSLVGAGLVVTTLTADPPSAVAAPGNPGVPGEPQVLFVEDFENRVPDSNVLLTDYTGASGTTYTADPVCCALTPRASRPGRAARADSAGGSAEGIHGGAAGGVTGFSLDTKGTKL